MYDVLSGEWPVYRVGRVAAIEQLGLRMGDRVLDVGCGTGLSFPLLRERIGDAGHLTGLDASEAMLGRAAERARAARWTNVELVHGPAARLTDLVGTEPYDAVLFTYSLSLFDDWRGVWAQALQTLRPVAGPQSWTCRYPPAWASAGGHSLGWRRTRVAPTRTASRGGHPRRSSTRSPAARTEQVTSASSWGRSQARVTDGESSTREGSWADAGFP